MYTVANKIRSTKKRKTFETMTIKLDGYNWKEFGTTSTERNTTREFVCVRLN